MFHYCKGSECGHSSHYAKGGHIDDGKSPDEKRAARLERHPVYEASGPGRKTSRHGVPHENQQGTSSAWSKGQSIGHRMDISGSDKSKTVNRKEEAKENLIQLKKQNPNIQGLADGGEVEELEPMKDMDGDHDGDMGSDDEIMDACADELMDALEKKDKRGILEAIKAIALSCKGE